MYISNFRVWGVSCCGKPRRAAGDQESDIGGHSCLTSHQGSHWASCLSSHCLPISFLRAEFSNFLPAPPVPFESPLTAQQMTWSPFHGRCATSWSLFWPDFWEVSEMDMALLLSTFPLHLLYFQLFLLERFLLLSF